MEKIINTISNELQVKSTQVENAIKLIDEGNTIPFIAWALPAMFPPRPSSWRTA